MDSAFLTLCWLVNCMEWKLCLFNWTVGPAVFLADLLMCLRGDPVCDGSYTYNTVTLKCGAAIRVWLWFIILSATCSGLLSYNYKRLRSGFVGLGSNILGELTAMSNRANIATTAPCQTIHSSLDKNAAKNYLQPNVQHIVQHRCLVCRQCQVETVQAD